MEGGFSLFVEDGKLKCRGPSGTVTDLTPTYRPSAWRRFWHYLKAKLLWWPR